MSAQERKWRIARGAPLLWKSWDDEHVVFDPRSGDTHALDLVAAEVLMCFDDLPLGPAELARRAANRLEVEPTAELDEYLAQAITRFDELGLIEAIDS